ncbi:MAG: mechanosensitive ion channel domain-containing protein [Candidatus Hodarchaeales archaeon]
MVVAQIPVDWDAIRNFLDSNAIIIGILFKVLIIIVAWIFFSLLIRKISGKLTPTQYNALKTLGRATILLFGLFWMGGNEFFIGAAALLGTAIGFASSSTIGNFISGLYLLLTNPFSVGDYVMLPNLKAEGIIEEISINYTNILTPEGIHIIIANQKLLGTIIKNTEITIPQEAVDKGKITWKDHENDSFDSVDDVVDILRGFRTKFANIQDQKYYLYPLEVKLNPDKYLHSQIKIVLADSCKEFSSRTDSEISWFMKDRSTYQLNLILANPYAIFDLKSDILGHIEEQIENIST